jgi:hypothetical protein
MYFFRPTIAKLVQKQDLAGLRAALGDRDPTRRADAARALGQLGVPEALPPLLAAFTDAEKVVRYEVAKALGRFQDDNAIRALLHALTDSEAHVRRQAVEALSAIGSAAIVPLIATIASGGEEECCQGATQALGDIEDEQVIPGLMLALQDKRGNVRAAAVEKLEKRRAAVLPFLVQAIEGEEAVLRQRALEVITRVCQAPTGQGLVTEALIHLLLQGHSQARQQLTPLISRLEVSDLSSLVFALGHAGPELRQWAYTLLEGFHWHPRDEAEQAVYLTVQAEQQEARGWAQTQKEKEEPPEPEARQHVSHFQVIALAQRLHISPKEARQRILQTIEQRGKAGSCPAAGAEKVCSPATTA